MLLKHFDAETLNIIIMAAANSLASIADSLVPEDQRKKIEPKNDELADEEFQKQLEFALKLSLTQLQPEKPKTPKKRNKFKKVEKKSQPSIFDTNDLTKLSYEEQLQLVTERSKFDSDIPASDSSNSLTSEEDQLEIALQISKDPDEQLAVEHQQLLKAIEASKLETEVCSDPESWTSSSSSSTFARGFNDVRSLNEIESERGWSFENDSIMRRGGGGVETNRQIIDNNNFGTDQESEDDEDYKLAVKLSLGQYSVSNSNLNKNSYSTAARKTITPPPTSAKKNVFADPLKMVAANQKPSLPPGMRRRPIFVDGCNVAFQHGKNDRYSAKGLLLVYQYFVTRHGYTNQDITIINRHAKYLTEEDKEIVESLYKIDVLIKWPGRLCGGQLIRCDDDRSVLELAKEKNGIVVSLDQFRNVYSSTRDKEIKDVIKYRLLPFAFKGDEIIFPSDPLGPGGPTLEEFLKY